MLGMKAEVILRTTETPNEDPGHQGNLLFLRSVGAKVHTVSVHEYTTLGSLTLLDKLSSTLSSSGLNPYVIPVGGSNPLGTWGYIEASAELRVQCDAEPELQDLTDIVVTAGSGGTAAGVARGVWEHWGKGEGKIPKVHAVGVCDSPDYFYKEVTKILTGMGFLGEDEGEMWVRDNINIVSGRGGGYGVCREEEIEFISKFARDTGVVLDTCYTGKAMYKWCKEMERGGGGGGKTLFWHTGGGLGTFKMGTELERTFEPARKLI